MDSLLVDTKKQLLTFARQLPEIEVDGKKTRKYERYDIDDLANGYCKATDEHNEYLRNVYMSALLLRFWSNIDKMVGSLVGTDFNRADVYERYYECIEIAMKDRIWQDPEKHTVAEACIKTVLGSRGVPAMLYEYNQKHRIKCTASLDDPLDDDSEDTLGSIIADEYDSAYRSGEENAIGFIQVLINNGKVVEAIVADIMTHADCLKSTEKTVKQVNSVTGEETKYKQYYSEPWDYKIIQELNKLDDYYYSRFMKVYKVRTELLEAARKRLEYILARNIKYTFIQQARAVMKEYVYQAL